MNKKFLVRGPLAALSLWRSGWSVACIAGLCLLALSSWLFGQAVVKNVNQVFNPATAADPCQNPGVAKSSVAITAAGQLVAAVSGQTVYGCDAVFTLTGTNPTAQIQAGAGTNCGTGTVNKSGAFAPTSGTELFLSWGGTVFNGGAGNAVCIALGGTSPSAQGIFTYVQQ